MQRLEAKYECGWLSGRAKRLTFRELQPTRLEGAISVYPRDEDASDYDYYTSISSRSYQKSDYRTVDVSPDLHATWQVQLDPERDDEPIRWACIEAHERADSRVLILCYDDYDGKQPMGFSLDIGPAFMEFAWMVVCEVRGQNVGDSILDDTEAPAGESLIDTVGGKYGTCRDLTIDDVRDIVMHCLSFKERGGKVTEYYRRQGIISGEPRSYELETLRSWLKKAKFRPGDT